jgi:hypothetical protein
MLIKCCHCGPREKPPISMRRVQTKIGEASMDHGITPDLVLDEVIVPGSLTDVCTSTQKSGGECTGSPANKVLSLEISRYLNFASPK